jgi:hypothetical protein
MGNNLDAYRAAIELFHACKMSLNIGYDSRFRGVSPKVH